MASNLSRFVESGKKIIGAGLNYKSILKERNLPLPEKPIFFLKATSSYLTEGNNIEIQESWNVHEEVELGLVIGKRGRFITRKNALEFIGGYCLALDLTEVSLIASARAQGGPWTLGKSFDTACPVSSFLEPQLIPDPGQVTIWCQVNGHLQQLESTQDMVFDAATLIEHVSQYMTLEPGDVILTGSPAGTGPIRPGDVVRCGLGDPEKPLLAMQFPVVDANDHNNAQ